VGRIVVKLHRPKAIRVEFEDGESIVIKARRVSWSYGLEWAEEWDDCEGRERVDLAYRALVDHVDSVDGVEDEDGPVPYPCDDDEAAREYLEAVLSPRQAVEVATHLVYEDSAGKSLASVGTA